MALSRLARGATLVAMLTVSAVASADDAGTAHALFDEGVRLYDKGDYAGSCSKLEASARLLPASGTSLNLGRCHEALGHLVKAWSAFEDASVLARRDNNASRAEFAHTNAERLRASLPRVRVSAEPGSSFEARLDGTLVDSAALGVAIPVEAGKHSFEARAPGKKPFVTTFEASAGKEASVVVPKLADEAAPRPAAPAPAPAPAPAESDSSWSGMKIAGVALGATGLVATGIGLGFGGYAGSLNSNAVDRCNAKHCDAQARSDIQHAGETADVATVLVSAGLVVLAAGVVLWFIAPKSERHTALLTF